MNEFKTYHPIINFVYFLFVTGFSMFFMHPLCLLISLFCAFTYSVRLKGRGAIKTNLSYMLPAVFLMALINTAFNHEGITILVYFPNGNPLTLESFIYGLAAATMIISVICWFSCYNEIMTSDKFIYLFGRLIPSLSLVISMTLRFVPRFLAQLKSVANAQKCIGNSPAEGNIIKRAKHGLTILSAMVSWSLENSVETADSMKSRGYGIAGRTSFSIYTFDKRDTKALILILASGLYILAGKLCGAMDFSFFPYVKAAELSPFAISLFASYVFLCIYPLIIEVWEVIKWKAIKSKI